MASGVTPHSPKVLPSAAYMEVQSKKVTLFASSLFIAAAVTALINSSVTKQLQLMVGDTSLISVPDVAGAFCTL